MNMKEILEKLDELIQELESLINEADGENPDETFIGDLDSGLGYLQKAYERKNK